MHQDTNFMDMIYCNMTIALIYTLQDNIWIRSYTKFFKTTFIDFKMFVIWTNIFLLLSKIFVAIASGKPSYLLVQLDENSLLKNDGKGDATEEVLDVDEGPPESDAVISEANLLNQDDGYIQKQFEAFLKQHKLEKKHFEKKEVGESEIFTVWTYIISSYRKWKWELTFCRIPFEK